jgi:AcrR family transcriptional regulator
MSDPARSADEDVVHAVRRALANHGYARLTTKNVAAESDKSEAGLYYHYDSKDEMVAAFLEWSTGWLAADLDDLDATDPESRLREACDRLFVTTDDEERRGVNVAVMELLSHAPHNETLREPLVELERHVVDTLAEVVADGVGQGVFRDVDPRATAAFLVAATDGSTGFYLALGLDEFEPLLRDGLSAYIDSLLVADA